MSLRAHVAVLVLGDVGRSPRMQYHANSLASCADIDTSSGTSSSTGQQIHVSLLGYEGEAVLDSLSTRQNVDVVRMKPLEVSFLRKVKPLHYIFKGPGLVFMLIYNIMKLDSVDILLVQNPPCIPALLAVLIVNIIRFLSFRTKIKIIIDWHNLGFSMFSINLGDKHWLVRVSFAVEKLLSRLGSNHLCVSSEMKSWLQTNFEMEPDLIRVFHDRPFRKVKAIRETGGPGGGISEEEVRNSNKVTSPKNRLDKGRLTTVTLADRHHLFAKLDLFDDILFPNMPRLVRSEKSTTIQTVLLRSSSSNRNRNSNVTNGSDISDNSNDFGAAAFRDTKSGRCYVAMTATSWTDDEDFDMLIEAIKRVDKFLIAANASLDKGSSTVYDRLLVIVTGKGPNKSFYEDKFKELQSSKQIVYVSFVTRWLEMADYPKLIACCDVGISLHTSTSGIDLPMKVLDMYGAGIPVFAVKFKAIGELVVDGANGNTFEGHKQLGDLLQTMVQSKGASVERLRVGAANIQSWDDNWTAVVRPLFTELRHDRNTGSGAYFMPVIYLAILAISIAYFGIPYFSMR